jgi:hypothetical protein
MTPERGAAEIDARLRARLTAVADGLIPAADGMPAASSVDIGGCQLDAVLASRPDLVDDVCRALESAGDVDDAIGWLEALRADDPSGCEALLTAVVGGYYMHPEVKRLLGYPGQVAQPVTVDRLPEYADEGLLERVYARGPIYRPTPRRGSGPGARLKPGTGK